MTDKEKLIEKNVILRKEIEKLQFELNNKEAEFTKNQREIFKLSKPENESL